MGEIPTFPARPSRLPKIIIFGGVAMLSGALGTLLLYWFFPEFREARIPPGSQAVIVQQPGRVVIEEGIKLDDVATATSPSIVSIYGPKAGIVIGDKMLYPEASRKAYGVIVTSDGWLGTLAEGGVATGDRVVVDGDPFTVESVVQDPASAYVLAKISGRAFPVSYFVSGSVRAGDTVAAITPTRDVFRTSVWDPLTPTNETGIFSTDKLDETITVHPKGTIPAGTPFYTLGSEFIGLQSAKAEYGQAIIPGHALQSFLEVYLKTKVAKRPVFGISYVILENKDEQRDEAVVYGTGGVGVVKNSPAGVAGLRAGDVILAVNRETVSPNSRSLFRAFQGLTPGQNVEVRLERDGEDVAVELKIQ